MTYTRPSTIIIYTPTIRPQKSNKPRRFVVIVNITNTYIL